MAKVMLTLGVLLFLLSVPAAHAATYYISPAPAGSDANDGSMFHPWLSPNHAVNCGDQILASASNSYSASSFGSGKWGPVSGSGHCLAFLICANFDSCKINASGSPGMAIDVSHWAVMGWEVTNSGNNYPCFEVYANGSNIGVTDILFANDIANGCYGSGFTIVSNGSAPADYVVAIADIAYNAAQENAACTNGFNFISPAQADSDAGTHLYISQSFAWANVEPNLCGGHTPSAERDLFSIASIPTATLSKWRWKTTSPFSMGDKDSRSGTARELQFLSRTTLPMGTIAAPT